MFAFVSAQKSISISDSAHLDYSTDSVVYTIGKVEIIGNKHTKTYIVAREFAVKEGDVFTPHELTHKLTLTKNQLMNTRMFNEVLVYVSNLKYNVATIRVEVKERWYLWPLPYFKLVDRNFNVWWFDENRDLTRANYGIKFTHDNLSGRRDKLGVDLVNGYNQQVVISYVQPFSDKALKHGFGVGLAYNRQREMSYKTNNNKQAFAKLPGFIKETKGAVVSYSYRPDSKYHFSASVGVLDENVNDTILKLNPQYYPLQKTSISFAYAGAILRYYNVDYIPFPQKGFMYELSIYNRGFSKQMNLLSISAEGTYALKTSNTNFIQFHNLVMLRANAKEPPYINQGMMGYGDVYLRGLESYVVDGTAGFLSNTTIYQKLFKYVFKNPLKTKNHERIPFTFYLKAFGDMGYVQNKLSSANSFSNTFLYTSGLGLDVVSMYDFVFRLEYSFNQFGNSGLGIRVRGDF